MRVRFVVLSLILCLVIPRLLWAQRQTVSPSELRQAVADAAKARQKNLDQVRTFFSSEPVRAAIKSGKIDYQKVEKAISTLNTDELARLASRTMQIERDFAAGAMSNQELTYIVIALAAAVVVLIAVVA